MQPINDFGHFLSQERAVKVDGTSGKQTGLGVRDP
jgi:hypothetical protein